MACRVNDPALCANQNPSLFGAFQVNIKDLSINDRLAIASIMHCLKTGMRQEEFDSLPESEKLNILDKREGGYLFVCDKKDIES